MAQALRGRRSHFERLLPIRRWDELGRDWEGIVRRYINEVINSIPQADRSAVVEYINGEAVKMESSRELFDGLGKIRESILIIPLGRDVLHSAVKIMFVLQVKAEYSLVNPNPGRSGAYLIQSTMKPASTAKGLTITR
jgi:hypothetical protein